MLLSLNWLKDFVDIPKKISPEELAQLLTMHTVEVDSVESQSEKYKNIIIGKILEVTKHPNADKLSIAKVRVGKAELNIVCGAPNIEAGQMVPVALPGAVLPSGLKIEETEIRGVKSAGMLCAEDELGLGDDHSGIFILGTDAKVGRNLNEYLKLKDTIFNIDNKSITHRPDLWSHFGIAREIAAFLNLSMRADVKDNFSKMIGKLVEESKAAAEKIKLTVRVEDFKLCPRYMAVVVEGVEIGPSPKWLQERLIAVGIRPIANIVDITNYVMMELGQPLHAFDKELLAIGDKIEILIRRASGGELIKTLDGKIRKLDENDLVIANQGKAVAIAGIMGGEESEIKQKTTAVVFESANFDFIAIRKTAQKLGLRTEASIRYEKSLDPNLCEIALARAVALTKEICPGSYIASNLADEKSFIRQDEIIEVDLTWLNSFLGERLKEKKVLQILNNLGFGVVAEGKKLKVTVPSWRATKDITNKEDLAEEIARIYGYERLKSKMPKIEMKAPLFLPERIMEKKIKNILCLAAGLSEVHNYCFISENLLKKIGQDPANYLRLLNPVSSELAYLRQSLAPWLISNLKLNQSRYSEIKIFEIGRVFFGQMLGEEESGEAENKLPYQEKRLGIALSGGVESDQIFLKAKSIVANLFEYLGLKAVFNIIEVLPDWADKYESAKIMVDKKMMGTVFKISPLVARELGLKKPGVIVEISLKELLPVFCSASQQKKYSHRKRYPPVIRDLALVVEERVLYNDLKREISSWHNYIESVELFDVFVGEKIGLGFKNMAFRIVYRADKTLTAAEVEEIQAGLVKRLAEKFGAKIRDF